MSDVLDRMASLPAEKRALLIQKLIRSEGRPMKSQAIHMMWLLQAVEEMA